MLKLDLTKDDTNKQAKVAGRGTLEASTLRNNYRQLRNAEKDFAREGRTN